VNKIIPKKRFGQHFLHDNLIASQIVDSLQLDNENANKQVCLEVGPGTGVLTRLLLSRNDIDYYAVEIEREAIEYLKSNFPQLGERLIECDFLKLNLTQLFPHNFVIIGNFPYNISSQIVFAMLEHRLRVPILVGMFQKEVAERIVSKAGSKVYGILSVLVQAYYHAEYLFTVEPESFQPPPKVKSGVIRLVRYRTSLDDCDEKLFVQLIKAGFNQRRKMLRNSLHQFINSGFESRFLTQRPEQLNVPEWIELTKAVKQHLDSLNNNS